MKLLYLITLVIIIGIYASLKYEIIKIPNEINPNTPPPTIEKPSDLDNDQISDPEELIKEIFSRSSEGRVLGIPFISGKTNWEEVNQVWGPSDNISETSKGRYEEYKSHCSTIGYADKLVNDVRSYDLLLNNISLNQIKEIGGEPDAIRYYKDSNEDQIILVYHVVPTTELLWILPIPTEQERNPRVDRGH